MTRLAGISGRNAPGAAGPKVALAKAGASPGPTPSELVWRGPLPHSKSPSRADD